MKTVGADAPSLKGPRETNGKPTLDAALAAAAARIAGWESMTLPLPAKEGAPLQVMIQEPSALPPPRARS